MGIYKFSTIGIQQVFLTPLPGIPVSTIMEWSCCKMADKIQSHLRTPSYQTDLNEQLKIILALISQSLPTSKHTQQKLLSSFIDLYG